MIRTRLPPPNIEPFSTSAAFSLISGLLSRLVPYFLGLTIALAALTASQWAARLVERRGTRPRPTRAPTAVAGAGALAGAAWLAVLAAPGGLGGWAGVLLGAASAGLWWTVRGGPGSGAP